MPSVSTAGVSWRTTCVQVIRGLVSGDLHLLTTVFYIVIDHLWPSVVFVVPSCFQCTLLITVLSFWACKSTVLSHKKFCSFATVREYQVLLSLLCRYEQVISVWNFALKFPAVDQKMRATLENNFLLHPVCIIGVDWLWPSFAPLFQTIPP